MKQKKKAEQENWKKYKQKVTKRKQEKNRAEMTKNLKEL